MVPYLDFRAVGRVALVSANRIEKHLPFFPLCIGGRTG